jgi:hypothetical protein
LAEETEKQFLKMKRDRNREDLIEKGKQLHMTNTNFIQNINTNWKATQQVKKDRQIRDLQFELAMLKIADVKEFKGRKEHEAEEKEGVVAFEKIMRRNGIGASDEGGGPPKAVSYEDKDSFLSRVGEAARLQWPSSEEVGDFMSQLKERTQDKRMARYEKARRRRRAVVDQAAAASRSNGQIAETSDDDK